MKRCYVCGQEDETKPLGEHGQDICVDCILKPEWRTLAANNLAATVTATSFISPSGMVTIDGDEIRPTRPGDFHADIKP